MANQQNTKKTTFDSVEQKVAIQMITFSIIVIIIILTLVSFIRIYSTKKEQILKDMQTEAVLLETVITDYLNHSKYFINMISLNIKKTPNDLNRIHEILKNHSNSHDFHMLFGWRKYSWINKDFIETVNSTEGIIAHPRYTDFIKNSFTKTTNNNGNKSKVDFYNSRKKNKANSLKVINNIIDQNNKNYIGSVVLSCDINTMIRHLNKRKTNKSTNFVLLNSNLEIIAQSTPFIQNIVEQNEEITSHLFNKLKNLNNTQMKNLSHLNMIKGVNYFITPLKGLPFIIILNIDNDIIRQNIIDSVTKKFIEVCVLAFICLFIIISIYKRETFLRTNAEKATISAINASKAKTDFLAFTAHEIRSPLGFVLTGSEIMRQQLIGQLPKQYTEYADGIHSNAKLILEFITDILDENQVIEGEFKIVNSLNNIKDIIDEAIKHNKARYNTRNIKIISTMEKDLPLLICDKRRVVQIISNLVSNSIKYSKDNTTIEITGKLINKELEIQVIDQGVGMNQDEIPIALSTYGTIHNANHNSPGSYGLGLAIVKMLLNAHNARFSIKSKKNEGTTITLVFPNYKLIYNAN